MWSVLVAQDHTVDAGEIDRQLDGVLEHSLRAEAGVEQEPSPIGLHSAGKPHSPTPSSASLVESMVTLSNVTLWSGGCAGGPTTRAVETLSPVTKQ